ncbi:MAG: TerC family protein [Deltaproteobacteria bacterium]|nr:TerC family protein [Deltaproteobacteria bacterium]
MSSVGTPLWWVGFNVVVLGLLAVDLLVLNREAHQIRIREAAIWSAIWIALSLGFNAFVYVELGPRPGLEFLTGYLLEKALSVDNLFVFVLILGHFRVPPESQHRVLFMGIIGALVTRVVFILTGTTLVAHFHPALYVFGAFLVYTGLKLAFSKSDRERPDLESSRALKLLERFVPVTTKYDGARFLTRENGRRVATPLLAVLVVIESTDVVFAVDSIPAILGVTTDPFIVYTSNICAILGLRALYFLLVGALSSLVYLKQGLAVILCFIGAKMLLEKWVEVPISVSLGVITGVLAITTAFSLLKRRARISVGAPPDE